MPARALPDTTRSIETPEGIELKLHLSGPVVRSLAWSIDTFIRVGIYILLGLVLAWLDDFGSGLFLILLFLIEWFYPVIFEVLSNGMTPGKRAMGIRVVHDDGTPIGWSASMVRNLLRFVDALPLFYAVGYTSMILHPEFRRLGDIVAGSVVIYPHQPHIPTDLPAASPLPPAQPLHSDEAQAVVSFAERFAQFTPERADELAAASGPLVPRDAAPAKSLLGIARWITGQ